MIQPAQLVKDELKGMLMDPSKCLSPKELALRVSTIIALLEYPFSSSTLVNVFVSSVLRMSGPTLFKCFIILKYFGGSGCPSSNVSINVCSSVSFNAQFVSFSYPTVDIGTAPRDFPQALPAP